MTISDHAQHNCSEDALTDRHAPGETYVRWLRDGMRADRWNSDPMQPCLLYKVYQGVERIPLDASIPLNMGNAGAALCDDSPAPLEARPDQLLAWILFYTHGLTRFLRCAPGSLPSQPGAEDDHLTRPVLPATFAGQQPHAYPMLGRPIPSGGCLHPIELYLVVTSDGVFPPGVYHYDSLHHLLDVVRKGDYSSHMASALPQQCQAASCSAFLLVAVCMQKNHQKYTEMSYRLQMLDAGIVTEQLRFLARRFHQRGSLCFQFQDPPLHHLLGLDVNEECIYAVLSLEAQKTTADRPTGDLASVSSEHLPALTHTHIQPFLPLTRNPMLDALYAASLQYERPTSTPVQSLRERKAERHTDALSPNEFQLPPASYPERREISSVLLRSRKTGFNAIDTSPMSLENLASLLSYTGQGCEQSELWSACDCRIYCVLSRVDTLPPGVYLYRSQYHTLVMEQAGNQFATLRRVTTAPNIHPHLVPVNLFLTGNYHLALARCGERGLRLLGIEIGRALQRLSLAAAERDHALHIHLSYCMRTVEEDLLHLSESSQLAIASAMLGPLRREQGGLFEMKWY